VTNSNVTKPQVSEPHEDVLHALCPMHATRWCVLAAVQTEHSTVAKHVHARITSHIHNVMTDVVTAGSLVLFVTLSHVTLLLCWVDVQKHASMGKQKQETQRNCVRTARCLTLPQTSTHGA
jgi:hypothetical protein